MSVSIGELKSILTSTIVEDYIQEGFKFNKSQFSFSKKIGRNKASSLFHFYNYAPLKVEYNFTFSFIIDEIEKEKEKFYKCSGREYDKEKTILFSEGHFHPKVRNEILKFQTAFTHIITDFEKDRDTIEDSRCVLRTEFFTRIPIFTDLANFQQLIINNYDFVLKYQGWLISSLIAAKFISRSELERIVEYIWIKEDMNNKDDRHILKRLIVDFLAF